MRLTSSLFPAQWPETYSYTLSHALASGLPIIAPNLGAFPERLSGRACATLFDHMEPVSRNSIVASVISSAHLNPVPFARQCSLATNRSRNSTTAITCPCWQVRSSRLEAANCHSNSASHRLSAAH